MSTANKDETSWLHKPTLVISIAAFVISVVTTAASAYRTYRQDVEARKTELRALISQINSAQLQSIEMMSKHQNDPYLSNISGTLNVQNTIMAKQAYVLVKEIGRDASSMDFGIVSYALANTGVTDLSEEMALEALERATNATEFLGATRQLAMVKMTTGRIAEAEIYWKKALNVYDVYPKDAINQQYVHYAHAWTQLSWTQLSTDCKMLLDHLSAADKEIDALGNSVPNDLRQWRIQFANACPTSTTTPFPATSFSKPPNAEQPTSAGSIPFPVPPAPK